MARGDDAHFRIILEVRKSFFVRAVRHDVLFHIVVGQSLVGIFEAVGADVALNNLIIGVIAADLLQVGVFLAHCVDGEFGEGAVHDDGVIGVIDGERVFHNDSPFLLVECVMVRNLAGSQAASFAACLSALRWAIFSNRASRLLWNCSIAGKAWKNHSRMAV